MRNFLLIAFTLLIAGAAVSQESANATSQPARKQVHADREKERLKVTLQLKQRFQRFMETRKLLVGKCGNCTDGFIVKGFSGGIRKAGVKCPADCIGGKKWSEKNVGKVTRDYFSKEGVSSEVAKALREEFRSKSFTLENWKRLVPKTWSYAERKDHVMFFGESHAHVFLRENGVDVDEPSAWVLAEDAKGKLVWCLWTEKDAPWPSEDTEEANDAAEVDDTSDGSGESEKGVAPAAEVQGTDRASGSAVRGVSLGAKRVAAADLAFDPEESAGVFVGVRKFANVAGAEGTSVFEVPYGVDDAIDLAHAFSIEFGLIPATRVTLCLAGEPQKPISLERLNALLAAGAKKLSADYVALRGAVKGASQVAQPKGILVMSFATHGFRMDDGDDILMASDSTYQEKATSITVRFITHEASISPATRRVLLFDVCRQQVLATRSGPIDGSGLSDSFAKEVGRHEGTFALFAAAVGGYSYDNTELGNGVFTGAFIDGMRGRATPDERNLITLKAIAKFVNQQVRAWRRSHEGSAPSSNDIEQHGGAEFDRMPLTLYHPATAEDSGESR